MTRREVGLVLILSPIAIGLGILLISTLEASGAPGLARLGAAAVLPTVGFVIWTVGRAPIRATACWVLPMAGVLYFALGAPVLPGVDELLIVGSVGVLILMVFSERTMVWWIERITGRPPASRDS